MSSLIPILFFRQRLPVVIQPITSTAAIATIVTFQCRINRRSYCCRIVKGSALRYSARSVRAFVPDMLYKLLLLTIIVFDFVHGSMMKLPAAARISFTVPTASRFISLSLMFGNGLDSA